MKRWIAVILTSAIGAVGAERQAPQADGFAGKTRGGAGGFELACTDNRVEIRFKGRDVASYYYSHEKVWRPFFANLKTPGGVPVTRNFPPKEGDSDDHWDMHPGLSLGFAVLDGVNFWHNREGSVVHQRFEKIDAGGDHASFTALNSYRDAQGNELCRETVSYTIRRNEPGFLLMIDTRLRASKPIFFGVKEEMGLAARMATPLTVKFGTGSIRNAAGGKDEKGTWGKVDQWWDYHGPSGGVDMGMQVMSAPGNPEVWSHSRDYGLLVANPFPVDIKENRGKKVEVAEGSELRLRFGVQIHEHAGRAAYDPAAAYRGYLETLESERRVRVVYLVSADREEKPEYTAAIEHAIRDLQKWYGKQLDGPTFRLNDPVVEVVKSQQNGDWFYGNPNGSRKDDWGFNNALKEAQRLLGARFDDPKNIWVIYSDGPGDKGRGGNGVTVLPENDLLGLVGKHPTQKNKLRWVAGLGHEAGHAFGLRHPSDTQKDADAIMWTGIYGKYPDQTYLTAEDKKILRRSSFFFQPDGSPVFQKGKTVSRIAYAGGAFEQLEGNDPICWVENKAHGDANFVFEELRRDDKFIVIHDISRRFTIRLPIAGGRSFLSRDGEKTWQPLYTVEVGAR